MVHSQASNVGKRNNLWAYFMGLKCSTVTAVCHSHSTLVQWWHLSGMFLSVHGRLCQELTRYCISIWLKVASNTSFYPTSPQALSPPNPTSYPPFLITSRTNTSNTAQCFDLTLPYSCWKIIHLQSQTNPYVCTHTKAKLWPSFCRILLPCLKCENGFVHTCHTSQFSPLNLPTPERDREAN